MQSTAVQLRNFIELAEIVVAAAEATNDPPQLQQYNTILSKAVFVSGPLWNDFPLIDISLDFSLYCDHKALHVDQPVDWQKYLDEVKQALAALKERLHPFATEKEKERKAVLFDRLFLNLNNATDQPSAFLPLCRAIAAAVASKKITPLIAADELHAAATYKSVQEDPALGSIVEAIMQLDRPGDFVQSDWPQKWDHFVEELARLNKE